MPGRSYTAVGAGKYRYGYQGSERDDEISSEGRHISTLFREGDLGIGQWWSIDPKALPYLSPYSMMDRNPIRYNDIYGDEIEVDESVSKDKNASKSLEAFAKTKQGKEFLSKYAKAGQTIGGVKFDKDGEYHNKGMDLKYTMETKVNKNGGGETETNYKYDDNINVIGTKTTVTLFTGKGWQTENENFNRAITIFHESFIHGALDAADYIDNKRLDHSNITLPEKEGAAMIEMHYHHSKVRLDFLKKGYKSTNLFPVQGYLGLVTVATSMKLNLTTLQIQSAMWNFSGGLNLDPATGDYIVNDRIGIDENEHHCTGIPAGNSNKRTNTDFKPYSPDH